MASGAGEVEEDEYCWCCLGSSGATREASLTNQSGLHRAHSTNSVLPCGGSRFNLLVINQDIDIVDPNNGENLGEINDVINSTESKYFPIKKTIHGKRDSSLKI